MDIGSIEVMVPQPEACSICNMPFPESYKECFCPKCNEETTPPKIKIEEIKISTTDSIECIICGVPFQGTYKTPFCYKCILEVTAMRNNI